MSLDIVNEPVGDAVVLHLIGALTGTDCVRMLPDVVQVATGFTSNLILQLADARTDLFTPTMLLRAHQAAQQGNAQLIVCGTNPELDRRIARAGLDRTLIVTRTQGEALALCAGQRQQRDDGPGWIT